MLTSHRGPHRTIDGYIAMLPYTDKQWRALFTAVGREELLEEPWYTDNALRLRNFDDVYAALAGVVRERTTAEWLEICQANGVPASPVPSLDEVVDDPALHMGALTEAHHPEIGPYRQIEPAARFSALTPVGAAAFACAIRQGFLPGQVTRANRGRLPATVAVSLSGAAGVRGGGVPYQALDALPLAGEPFAAAIDLIFTGHRRRLHAGGARRADAQPALLV